MNKSSRYQGKQSAGLTKVEASRSARTLCSPAHSWPRRKRMKQAPFCLPCWRWRSPRRGCRPSRKSRKRAPPRRRRPGPRRVRSRARPRSRSTKRPPAGSTNRAWTCCKRRRASHPGPGRACRNLLPMSSNTPTRSISRGAPAVTVCCATAPRARRSPRILPVKGGTSICATSSPTARRAACRTGVPPETSRSRRSRSWRSTCSTIPRSHRNSALRR